MVKPRVEPSRLLNQTLRQSGVAYASDSRYLVSVVPITPANGGEATSFGIKFEEAQKPPRSYSAEACAFTYRDNVAELIFCQRELVGDRIDSALVMRVHISAVAGFLESVREMDGQSLEEVVQLLAIKPSPLAVLSENPRQLAKLSANVIHVSVAGYEAALDFYQMSPISRHWGQRNGSGKVELEPIARVDLSTGHLMSLVEAARVANAVFAAEKG